MDTTPDPVLDRPALRRLCELARLHVPAEHQPELLSRLQRVVAAFGALRDVASDDDTTSPPPIVGTPLRRDIALAPLPMTTVLGNAPKAAADCFLVPRVVDA